MNFVSKFRVEAQASAALSHPNIVNVYDVCEDDGKYFIVMELVEGITLKDFIRQKGRLDMNTAIDFSIQIASGLAAAHENHVIHRDIKPQNIIVGSNGALKVTDFGIAKAATSNTMSTTNMGSVHYISPEQARGGYSDERSDIYSLGITMYEMVTGRVPFEGDTNVSIALMHIQNEIIPPTRLYPDIYSSLEKVIMKAVQKKPERRYLTANALIADLNRVKNNPNIDIIVAPSVVTNSPTREFTENDIQAIKRESGLKNVENVPQYTGAAQPYAGQQVQSSVPQVNRARLDQLMQEEDDSLYDVPETPVKKKGIKKVEDDYDEYPEERQERYEEPEEDDDDAVDPKLEKVVMIAGIAAAVIIAVILFILLGNVLGWFKFGKGSDEKTTAKPTTTTTEAVSTENTGDSSTTETTSETTSETTEQKTKKMINVEGLSESAAKSQLEKAGFTNVRVDRVNDDNVPENYVIKQSVAEAEVIEIDREIVITVSLGAAELPVPNVAGKSVEEADSMISEAGFNVTHSYELSETVEKNYVIRTDPEAGVMAASGSTIKIIVSNGPKEVQVPDVKNLTEEAAVSTIESLKLAVGEVKREPSDTVPEGRIISQTIDPSASVPEGTPIGFTVSTGRAVKTFSATVSGEITPYDGGTVSKYIQESGGSIHIVVSFDDGKEKHTIVDQDLNAGSFPFNVNQTFTGLEGNEGSVLIIINDQAGNEITSMFDVDKVRNVTYTAE